MALAVLAGVVDQVGDHFEQVFALAAEGDVAFRFDGDVDRFFVVVLLLHHEDEVFEVLQHRRAVGDRRRLRAGARFGARRDAGAAELALDEPLHLVDGLLQHLVLALPSAAAFFSTAIGVFSACARLPTWRRARSTTSRL